MVSHACLGVYRKYLLPWASNTSPSSDQDVQLGHLEYSVGGGLCRGLAEHQGTNKEAQFSSTSYSSTGAEDVAGDQVILILFIYPSNFIFLVFLNTIYLLKPTKNLYKIW